MAATASDETTSLIDEGETERYDDAESVNNDENQSEPRRQSSEQTEGSTTGSNRRSRRPRPRKSSEDEEMTLKYGARHLLLLIVPVSICMLVVVATVLSVKSYASEDAKLIYIPYDEKDSSSSQKLGQALVNTLVFLGIVVVMTIVLVVLYKYRFYKTLYGWLIATTAALVFLFAGLYLAEMYEKYNVAMDWITYVLTVWNFGFVGMVVIHWKGPLRLLQVYHIVVSALMALIFIKYLPDWTTWLVLGAFVLYGVIPWLVMTNGMGPLRVLVETAKERNEDIFPSLIYTSTMLWSVTMADNETRSHPRQSNQEDGMSSDSTRRDEGKMTTSERHSRAANRLSNVDGTPDSHPRRRQQPEQTSDETDDKKDEEESRGAKLGLGDFIFYSILLGKAANDSGGDWNVILACFISILIGLCLTLLLLSIFKRALPALPISITFGLIFYFATRGLISPLISALAEHQVFI